MLDPDIRIPSLCTVSIDSGITTVTHSVDGGVETGKSTEARGWVEPSALKLMLSQYHSTQGGADRSPLWSYQMLTAPKRLVRPVLALTLAL